MARLNMSATSVIDNKAIQRYDLKPQKIVILNEKHHLRLKKHGGARSRLGIDWVRYLQVV